MTFTVQELQHILTALDTMSQHDVARAREMITVGTTNHNGLKQKIHDAIYRMKV
jgi:hypothetical protein|tara:strand:- start:94 stop:255 length:162 start_codon:yes stop_codon:yes gene_type:complete